MRPAHRQILGQIPPAFASLPRVAPTIAVLVLVCAQVAGAQFAPPAPRSEPPKPRTVAVSMYVCTAVEGAPCAAAVQDAIVEVHYAGGRDYRSTGRDGLVGFALPADGVWWGVSFIVQAPFMQPATALIGPDCQPPSCGNVIELTPR